MIRARRAATIGIVLLAVAAGLVHAQDVSVGGRLSLVGGGVFFENKESNDFQQPLPGLQIGGVMAYRSHSALGLQAELWYVQKGWNEPEAGGGRRLAYVELPVFVTLTAPWTTAPQLLAGASGSLEIGCSVTGVPNVGNVRCDDPRVEWRHRKAQLATWAGVGVRRRLDTSHLDLQLLVSLHPTNLNREALPLGYMRLFSLGVSAVYAVALGGR